VTIKSQNERRVGRPGLAIFSWRTTAEGLQYVKGKTSNSWGSGGGRGSGGLLGYLPPVLRPGGRKGGNLTISARFSEGIIKKGRKGNRVGMNCIRYNMQKHSRHSGGKNEGLILFKGICKSFSC